MSRNHSDRRRNRKYSGSDDDSAETRFSIPPREAEKAKEERYRRERNRENERRDRKRSVDDGHRDREAKDKHRDYDRGRRGSPTSRDRRRHEENRRDRDSEKDRGHRKDRRTADSPPKSKKGRGESPKHSSEKGQLFDRVLNLKVKEQDSKVLEIEDVEMSPTPLLEEVEIKTFTLDYDFGPARPPNSLPPVYESLEPEPESASKPVSTEKHPDVEDGEIDDISFDKSADNLKEAEPNSTLDQEALSDEDEKFAATPEPDELELMSEEDKHFHKDAMEKRAEERNREIIAALPTYYPGLYGCQPISEYKILNTIAEGTYGEVFRGQNKRTDEIVALKRFKLEKEKEGFPITALREINMLLKAGSHENVVNVKEILVGSSNNDIFMAMEFIEHDLKSLMDKMRNRYEKFKTGQQKTLMLQLLSGMKHLHDNWILHRDLKTSNLLFSHSGVLKIADFGLAREFGDRRQKLTPLVVTLWYRSPELLLEPLTYSTHVDMWSIGCIMGEIISMEPMFPGKNEPNQVDLIFRAIGTPDESTWPGLKDLAIWRNVSFEKYPSGALIQKYVGGHCVNKIGFNLLNGLLALNPTNRLTADEALNHSWFQDHPLPVPRSQLPKYPAKSELNAAVPRKSRKEQLEESLKGLDPKKAEFLRKLNVRPDQLTSSGFHLKF
uniref:cyclin-dependent kinase n=1 Tax=Caenorhabditis japonica TaxID=281687 RepID=A0A8R1DHG1_CAEJA